MNIMSQGAERQDPKIYPFPPRGRFKAPAAPKLAPFDVAPAVDRNAWYHDVAIAEEAMPALPSTRR
jgi:hypothetical protein